MPITQSKSEGIELSTQRKAPIIEKPVVQPKEYFMTKLFPSNLHHITDQKELIIDKEILSKTWEREKC